MREKIVAFNEVKQGIKILKKEETELKEQFTKFLQSEGLDSITDEESGLMVAISMSEKITVDEDRLLKAIKQFIKENKEHEFIKDIKKCVKRVETVNEDQIEHLIRSGILEPSILESATDVTYTPRINVKKAKKGAK